MKLENYRTLIVLTFAQCFGQTAAPILVLLGGIVGAQIAPSLDWATLPIAIQIIGIASATIPASYLMSKVGRKAGFLGGTALAIFAALFAAWGIFQQSFALFCIASFFIGNYIAFLQQFRFAVAESVPKQQIPKCLSFLMLAGIVAALLGPEVGRRFSVIEGLPNYVGSFLGMAAMLSVSFLILLLFYRNTDMETYEQASTDRSLGQIFRQPTLILAIASAAVGYSVMSLIMTATPLSMHELDLHSLDDTTRVIQSHILAMYVPSFFSGFLISWLGVKRIIQAGFALMLVCVAIGWGQPDFINYWGTLIFLGVGWNFLFLGGTTLLTQSYRNSERFKVQAVNDFLVFGLQAVGSLSAGVLLASIGWSGVMLFSLPLLLLLVPVLFITRKPAT
ncbi:MAG TPA: MFS transporter [Gammaproteobacteria bacterium]|nr:MFS transporter [Gammaproteobacteria bacterium]MDC0413795.1 MFS transporter [Gammaproteobacteria bacterium]HAS49856.1 MFS transporter [Gammaproteobacteria bacterium]